MVVGVAVEVLGSPFCSAIAPGGSGGMQSGGYLSPEDAQSWLREGYGGTYSASFSISSHL